MSRTYGQISIFYYIFLYIFPRYLYWNRRDALLIYILPLTQCITNVSNFLILSHFSEWHFDVPAGWHICDSQIHLRKCLTILSFCSFSPWLWNLWSYPQTAMLSLGVYYEPSKSILALNLAIIPFKRLCTALFEMRTVLTSWHLVVTWPKAKMSMSSCKASYISFPPPVFKCLAVNISSFSRVL